jgi:putative transposase
MKRYRKRPRLKDFGYKGYHRYFVTICTHNRIPIFKNDAFVRRSIKILKDISNNLGFKVWAYCFMPDHLHLLVEGGSSDSDLKRFISTYKQYTGYYYKDNDYVAQGFSPAQTKIPKLWQPSYYDHVLRKDEDTLSVARYVVGNPVRKALVKHFLDYEFIGSFELDIESLL